MEGCPILADLHSLPFRFIYDTKQTLSPLRKCLTLLFPVYSCEKCLTLLFPVYSCEKCLTLILPVTAGAFPVSSV